MTSTVSFPLDAQTVRDFLTLNVDTTSRYTNATISSNIRTAVGMLERLTNRKLADVTATYKFSTDGRDYVGIPGLRSATTVTKTGSALVADASYYLVPDVMQSGVYTGIRFGRTSYRVGPAYLSNPEWFDRNLDSPLYQAFGGGALPNDLVIAGSWGYDTTTCPDDVILPVKVLAAHLTKIGDANTAGFLATPDGNVFDLSHLPGVVQEFVAAWGLSPGVAGA